MTPLLNTADAVRLGSSAASKVYLGTAPVWPPSASFVEVSTDGNGVVTYNATTPIINDGNPIAVRVLAPTNASGSGLPHNFLYMLVVEAFPTDSFGDPMADVAVALGLPNKYNVTVIAANMPGQCWYGDSITDPGDQRVTYLVDDVVPWVTETFGTGGEGHLLIGFSRSGMGGQDLLLHYPAVFAKAASWDFPSSSMDSFNEFSADIFGNQENFEENYQLSEANVAALAGPFTGSDRIWIGGYEAFQADIVSYDAMLTSLGMQHTLGAMANITHEWQSGWVEPAVQALVGYVPSDNFNRANGTPGPNWVQWNGDLPMAIASNQLVGASDSDSDTGVIRNATAAGEFYTGNHFSEVAAPTAWAGNAIGPSVRCQGTLHPGVNAAAQYVAIWLTGSPFVVQLFACGPTGSFTPLGSAFNLSGPPTPGDRLRLTAVGSALTVTLNGTTIITATDSTYTGGAPGILANGSAACDNWLGGNV